MDALMQQILNEASSVLEKTANDDQGAPDTAKTQKQDSSVDIVAAATEVLKGIEQLKASLTQSAGAEQPAATTEDTNQNETQQTEPNAEPTVSGTQTTIQTPGGSIIKLAMAAFANKLS